MIWSPSGLSPSGVSLRDVWAILHGLHESLLITCDVMVEATALAGMFIAFVSKCPTIF